MIISYVFVQYSHVYVFYTDATFKGNINEMRIIVLRLQSMQ